MLEVVSKTNKYITIRMPLLYFKSSGIFPDAEYDFAAPDEKKVFDKYKDIDIKKLKTFDNLLVSV